jgi:16S rRNA (guanine527-N7)-methyltransferase|tara:strand:+ start:181 stop:813 length:633 start_codon:yes stop_codon:yes gene_type:complete
MEELLHYFPGLTAHQIAQFELLSTLYKDWNLKINVVSRKDIDEIYLRHVLHSLAIAKVQPFLSGSSVLDVGTGGGFPGIPLAILFPEVQFHLVDSIGKKIKVVEQVRDGLALQNVKVTNARVETITGQYDFIVSRAVAQMETFVRWVKNRVAKKSNHDLKNGILYLKGGDLTQELATFPKATIHPISSFYKEVFFDTKSVVHLPLKFKGK